VYGFRKIPKLVQNITMRVEEAIIEYERQPLTRQVLFNLLRDYESPSDKISELVKRGILTLVKAKVYVPGPNLKMRGPEPYLLANQLASPSYVSMETALSHWGIIPERVFEIASAFTGRSRIYETPVGRFRYTRFPLPYFSFGQVSLELAPRQVVLIANAEKALCDTVIATTGLLFRSPRNAKEWLLDNMRMERDILRELNTTGMREWINDAPKKESLGHLIKALEDL
jgi:hypothetical protein